MIYTNVYFTPIHPREQREKLTATCPELGVFPRELRLISVEVQLEPPTVFETPFGTSLKKEFLIKNLSLVNATLHGRTDSEDFTINPSENVAAGASIPISVVYEPSEIGSTTATAFVESEQAGNFVYSLIGICVKPTAKGPFIIKPGSALNIPFKNVFKKAKEFHMMVDNPAFILKSVQETISPKEECKIEISMLKVKHLERTSDYKDSGLDVRFPVMGQLIVECFNPYVKWQFYLKGVLE